VILDFGLAQVFGLVLEATAVQDVLEGLGPLCKLTLAQGGSVNELLAEKSLIPICM